MSYAFAVPPAAAPFDSDVMAPSPLTRLLSASMVINPGEIVIDLGSGCGALTMRALELHARLVYAIELNINGTRAIYEAARAAGHSHRVLAILGDMSQCEHIPLGHIDVIVSNPPQLPAPVGKTSTYAAGVDGRLYLDGVLRTAAKLLRRGEARRLELVTTSVVGIDKTFSQLRRLGFSYKVTGQQDAEFRPAYYDALSAIDPSTYRLEDQRGFETIYAISAQL